MPHIRELSVWNLLLLCWNPFRLQTIHSYAMQFAIKDIQISRTIARDQQLCCEFFKRIMNSQVFQSSFLQMLLSSLCSSLVRLEHLLAQPESAEFFSTCQSNLRLMLPLHTYLLKPVQRILKYHLLLEVSAKRYCFAFTFWGLRTTVSNL